MTEELTTQAVPVDSEKATPTVSSGTGENWERRFKGLQVAYDKLKKQHDDLAADLQRVQGELEEARQTGKAVNQEKELTKSQLSALQAEKEELNKTISGFEAKQKRTQVIMSDFQDLMQFEAKGLLPEAPTEEELRQKLTDYRAVVQSMVGNSVSQKLQGQGPVSGSAGNAGGKRSKDTVYAELLALSGRRDEEGQAKFLQVRDEWDELNS